MKLSQALTGWQRFGRLCRDVYECRVPESEGKRITDSAAYWERSAHEGSARDLSHWLGEGRWSDEVSWRQIGERHFSMYQTLRGLANFHHPVRAMVEWGPGGGANATRFCTEIARIYGVDISDANLRECERQFANQGFKGFQACLIPASQPEQVLEAISEPIDLFLSTAVYQHFPSKLYGVRITAIASRLLAVGGLCLMQIRYDDGRSAFRSKVRNYFRNAISFTSYRIPEFWQLLYGVGFEPLALSLDARVNYAYFFSVKRAN